MGQTRECTNHCFNWINGLKFKYINFLLEYVSKCRLFLDRLMIDNYAAFALLAIFLIQRGIEGMLNWTMWIKTVVASLSSYQLNNKFSIDVILFGKMDSPYHVSLTATSFKWTFQPILHLLVLLFGGFVSLFVSFWKHGVKQKQYVFLNRIK